MKISGMKNQNNEVWVFLSHSNEDYEKVKIVRDILEKDNFRPIMFFLKCLDNNDEIDSLIEREIKARTRFILCDSENARKSNWVQREVEIIKTTGRMYETVDLNKSTEELVGVLNRFKRRSSVLCISDNNEIQRQINSLLLENDFICLNSMINIQNSMGNFIDKIRREDGYILLLLTNETINSSWVYCELDAAYQTDTYIIPVFLEKIKIPYPDLEQYLTIFNRIDVSDYPDSEKARIVVETLINIDSLKNK